MTTRERSSVQSVRSSIWRGIGGKAKKVTRVGAWCGRARMRTHLTHGIWHQNPRNTTKQEHPCRIASPTWSCKSRPTGVWWEISHTREYAHARTHTQIFTYAKRGAAEAAAAAANLSHRRKGVHGRDLDLDLHHTAGNGNSAVMVVVVSKPRRAAYHPRAARSLRTSLGTRPPPPPPRPSACSRNGQGSCGSNGRVGRCRARQAR